MVKSILVCILCFLLLPAYGQENHYPVSNFDLRYSLGLQIRHSSLIPVRDLDTSLIKYGDHAPVTQGFSIGYAVKPRSFLAVGAALEYIRLHYESDGFHRGDVHGQEDSVQLKNALHTYGYRVFGINLYTEFDLLWNLPDDALLMKVGLNTAWVQRYDTYTEYIKTGEAYHAVGKERLAVWFRPYFSFAWEEYLGRHWGYRLGLTWYPAHHFTPYKLKITNDIRKGEEFPNQVYSYSDNPQTINELPREKIDHTAYNLHLSILYRL